MGYVGLPLAREAIRSGLRVIGPDTREEVVAGLRTWRYPVDDLSDDHVAETRAGGVAIPVARRLIAADADVTFQDPHAKCMNVGACEIASVPDPYAAAAPADVCGLVQNHSIYDVAALAATGRRLLGTRGVIPPSARVESP